MVSVCIIAKNEEKTINQLFWDIVEQDYHHQDMEIVLVDSMSTDETKKQMSQFASNCKEYGFSDIRIYDNLVGNQAGGWNVAIKNSKGDVIIRVDAHAKLPKEFVRKSIECIRSGEDVCGGPRPNIAVPHTKWTDVLLGAESSMFGSSIASYRRENQEKKYVNSVFHGAYRKEVFEKVGLFNEKLGRTEDNEMHYRIRQAGYKICYDQQICSYQHIRSTWSGMLKQKYANGYWIGLTVGVCPGCLACYHFIPAAFVLGMVALFILGLYISWFPFSFVAALYLFFCLINTVVLLVKSKGNWYFLMTPFIFISLHIMYGIGTWVGIVKMPWWKKHIYNQG